MITTGLESRMTGIAIRAAASGDMLSVGLIERDSFADPWGSREFTSALESPHTIFLVAVDEDGIVCGYVIALAVQDEAEVLNLAVRHGDRGKGIGAGLLDASIRQVRQRGAANIYLEVRESNDAARGLYASRGFEEISRRVKYYRSPVEDALILHLAVQ
jgi:ribosomal-protein-alanine N-acetyltransferase